LRSSRVHDRDQRQVGFSTCDPQRLYLPLNMDPIYGDQALNVEAQQHNPANEC
jgi:maltose alpha-D-glucosyltransferase/alpha-amylase